MKSLCWIPALVCLWSLPARAADVPLVTDRNLERTGFQDPRPFTPAYDLRNDFVMLYGTAPERVAALRTWIDQGYVPHLMTGIAWGNYQDFRDLAGEGILSLAQVEAGGAPRLHGPGVPYVVPSVAFADYLTDKLRPLIDAGVRAIHLEEPEFWADTGFSPAFAREWRLYYHEPYQRADRSPDAQYRASRLKYHLYGRALRRVAEASKAYALARYDRELRIYVPTHSLINYTQWRIVSPQSSLIDSAVVDGCVAQVWTGTARTPNVYEGRLAERTFATAFLEYGVMQELVRGTGRRMWFLHDPIEDNPRHDWADYRRNYRATLIASLMHPAVWHYEICPWPSRVFLGRYPARGPTARPIPPDYATTLNVVFNQLRDMRQPDTAWQDAPAGLGVFLADSAMFQRAEPAFRLAAAAGTADPTRATAAELRHLSGFYGLTLPLLLHGVPVQPVQLDNVARFPNYLDDYRVLVLSYEFMKPETPALNQAVAAWVARGGALVYVGADTDPFHTVRHWWNAGTPAYHSAAEHLFELLGLDPNAAEGDYRCGRGHVYVQRRHPAFYTRSAAAAEGYRTVLRRAAASVGCTLHESNRLVLRRGPYVLAACLRESGDTSPLHFEGLFVDVFDPNLTVRDTVTLRPGQQAWLLDLERLPHDRPRPLASAARIETWQLRDHGVTFDLSAPAGVRIVTRLRLPGAPRAVLADGLPLAPALWEPQGRTLFFVLPAGVQRASVSVDW